MLDVMSHIQKIICNVSNVQMTWNVPQRVPI